MLFPLGIARSLKAPRPSSFRLAACGASFLGAGAILADAAFDDTLFAALEALLGVSAVLGLVWPRLAGTTSIAPRQWAWIVAAGVIMFVPLWGTLALLQRSQGYLLRGAAAVPAGRVTTPIRSDEPVFCNVKSP